MTDDSDSPATEAMPTPAAVTSPQLQVAGSPPVPPSSFATDEDAAQVASDRPELVVAGAFAAGFLAAMILKRIAK